MPTLSHTGPERWFVQAQLPTKIQYHVQFQGLGTVLECWEMVGQENSGWFSVDFTDYGFPAMGA